VSYLLLRSQDSHMELTLEAGDRFRGSQLKAPNRFHAKC